MFKTTCLVVLLWCVLSPVQAAEPDRDLVTLPLYPLKYEIFNSAGDALVTRGEPHPEFKTLVVSAAKDPSSPTGYLIPRNLREAAAELQKMLPSEFYGRLLSGHEKIPEFAGIPNDPGVDERIEDLARFLHEIWGLDDEHNPLTASFSSRYLIERLVEILAQAQHLE